MTYELYGSSLFERQALREKFGSRLTLEYLGEGYWNVTCLEEDADAVAEMLDTFKTAEYRAV